jgi:hypothetical protein
MGEVYGEAAGDSAGNEPNGALGEYKKRRAGLYTSSLNQSTFASSTTFNNSTYITVTLMAIIT